MADARPLQLEEGQTLSALDRDGESVYFEVTRTLGAGGAGTVWESVADDGRVAVIKGPRLIGQEAPAVAREARLLQELPPHPNLVDLLGVARDPRGHHLLFLERAFPNPLKALNEGQAAVRVQDLRGTKARYLALPVSLALELGYELALALEHLHEHKLCHCDVKPENLLLRLDWAEPEITDNEYFQRLSKGEWRGVLIDLGGARTFKELNEASAGAAGAELPAVTPIYAPPEVLPGGWDPQAQRERSRFTPWMDVYAFGLTLYQYLTGHVPYDHLPAPPDERSLQSVAHVKREERDGAHLPFSKATLTAVPWSDCSLEQPSQELPSPAAILERLWTLLARSVHHEPAKRGTMRQMRRDLGDLLGVRPAESLHDPLHQREWSQHRIGMDRVGGRLAQASRDGTQEKVDLTKIRRRGEDFWEMQGFR